MTIDLIILGMLMEKPQSAYDIHKDIESHHLDRWSKISVPSVYKKVIQLEEKGLLESTVVSEGKRSRKAVYTITDAGVERFKTLMHTLSVAEPLAIFDFNILISNITKLEYDEGIVLMRNLEEKVEEQLEKSRQWREEYADIPFNGRAILDQQTAVYETLRAWLDSFAQEYRQMNEADRWS